ncbi:MAG: acyl-CoA thioesterase [Anaerolineales bacterium]|nr:acyl-CoA thioesterase [Anaerolineales bacterium]
MKNLKLQDFPLKTFDKIRYADTDRQGHVNNANFSSFLETGRVEVLYNPNDPVLREGASFVIASLKLEFLNEITWPGEVHIGTGVLKIGNSSLTLFQRLFQEEQGVANAETVIVQVDQMTRRSAPLTDHAKQTLSQWLLNEGHGTAQA